MSQSAPGWYQDHDDPRLARWWDGERWTEHTLVLDEQDWSTEPDPPVADDAGAGTRFPVDTGSVTAVEGQPGAGWAEDDIYAPIRDPWADEPAAEPSTQAWSAADQDVWAEAAAGGSLAATPLASGWDDERWVAGGPGPRRPGLAGRVQDWPSWAKVGLPLAVLALVLLAVALVGLGGGGSDTTTTTSTTTATISLDTAANTAFQAAGAGPYTVATFSTLIPITCDAAESNDPSQLTLSIVQLNYDATTISALVNGLRAGTQQYCPDKMAQATTLLDQVETAAVTGASTSTSTAITVPGDTSSTTKKPTTSTTKKPGATTSTTKATTTTAPATTTTTPPTSTTDTSEPPSTTTTT